MAFQCKTYHFQIENFSGKTIVYYILNPYFITCMLYKMVIFNSDFQLDFCRGNIMRLDQKINDTIRLLRFVRITVRNRVQLIIIDENGKSKFCCVTSPCKFVRFIENYLVFNKQNDYILYYLLVTEQICFVFATNWYNFQWDEKLLWGPTLPTNSP